jgi:hypothetical protein
LLTVPFSAPSLATLIPAVTVSDYANFTPSGAQDFTSSQTVPVAYTVTSEDGNASKVYQVTVIRAAASTACDMVSFTAAGVSGVITPGTPNTVVVTLPPGTPVSALTPSVGVSAAASFTPSGAQDFTNSATTPVSYTVTAEDGLASKVYQVTVTAETGAGYGAWAAANGASSNPLEDSNHNGVPNGVEYFMGGTLANPATLPPLADNAGTWTWTIPYDPAAAATYLFQVSGDLSGWSDALSGDIEVLTGPDQLRLTLPSGMRFCRLLVTTP